MSSIVNPKHAGYVYEVKYVIDGYRLVEGVKAELMGPGMSPVERSARVLVRSRDSREAISALETVLVEQNQRENAELLKEMGPGMECVLIYVERIVARNVRLITEVDEVLIPIPSEPVSA